MTPVETWILTAKRFYIDTVFLFVNFFLDIVIQPCLADLDLVSWYFSQQFQDNINCNFSFANAANSIFVQTKDIFLYHKKERRVWLTALLSQMYLTTSVIWFCNWFDSSSLTGVFNECLRNLFNERNISYHTEYFVTLSSY